MIVYAVRQRIFHIAREREPLENLQTDTRGALCKGVR
jgi:hypothetical protein